MGCPTYTRHVKTSFRGQTPVENNPKDQTGPAQLGYLDRGTPGAVLLVTFCKSTHRGLHSHSLWNFSLEPEFLLVPIVAWTNFGAGATQK